MNTRFGRSLFGFKPAQVINEMQRKDAENQEQVVALQARLEQAHQELAQSSQKVEELQQQLNNYIERERLIADVMVTAHKKAQSIEEEAREKARALLEQSEKELHDKNQELDHLRQKVARFKEEFREVLDNYRFSLEAMKDPSGETSFTPTLIVGEKSHNSSKTQDRSS